MPSSSSSSLPSSSKSKRGIDTLLTTHGKSLQTGEEIRFVLIKGPKGQMVADPVNPKAPKEQFPLIAKFGESVVTPHLQKSPWNRARLYQQDVPKAEEDSDDEEAAEPTPAAHTTKKRWRRRKEVPKRQWVLQEQVAFLESMMAKRQRVATPKESTSSKYAGVPEHNRSQYCLLEEQPPPPQLSSASASSDMPPLQIRLTVLPTPKATVSFKQHKVVKALSMTEAEHAIQDQRGKMTRFMMHDKQQLLHATKAPTNESRKRLFGKLAAVSKKKSALDGDDEDEDDIMGDLTFRNRNRKGGGGGGGGGGGSKARKELLNSLGDASLKVDADGVLGGANDSEFGRGQRFGRFKAEQQEKKQTEEPDIGKDIDAKAVAMEQNSRGNDGLAMADDFYQRDVQAEYEELDYDANEQFDNDDVDVGETEVVVEGSGYADEDEDEDDDLDDDDMNGDKPSGAEGLASLAGFRLLLAKARGEITPEQAAEAAEGAKLKEKQHEEFLSKSDENRKRKRDNDGDDHLSQIMAAAEQSREDAERKRQETSTGTDPATQQAPKKAKLKDDSGVQLDENGQRLITLKTVQNEIWLRHCTIPIKRLMRIFEIKKKTPPERRTRFTEVVKELCIMKTDAVDGRVLVLKQHYSKKLST